MFALGLLSWLYTRPMARHRAVPEEQVRRQARDPRGQPRGAATPASTTARRPRTSPSPTRSPRPGCRPAPTATSPATSRWPTAWSPRPTAPGVPLVLGSYPITPASDILHTLVGAQALRRDHAPGRGRDRRRRRGARRRVRRRARRHHDLGPGPGPEGRDDRPGRVARAAAGRLRRPARRALDRPADQDRAGRPAAGDVRPQRRVAGADRRPAVPRRLLRRRAGGGADRHDLPHAGAAALRRLPRQRLRAVAASRTWPTCPSCACEFATEPNGTDAKGNPVFHPYLRDPETLARPWAVPGTPGLEHRIGGIEKADVTGEISYDPDNHDTMVRLRQAKIDGIAARSPDLEVDDPTGDADVLVLGWGSTYGPIAAATRLVRNAGHAGRPGPPAPPQPVPGQHRRGAPPLPAGRRAGDEPRPARRCCCAPGTSSTSRLHAGARAAVHRGRAGRRAHQAAEQVAERRHRRSESLMTTVDLGMPLTGTQGVPRLPRGRAGADQEGVHLRPGGALVPRLRRLRDPRRRAGLPARARAPAREHRLRLGHRLLLAVPVLPGHLRHALDPRARAGHRHRPGHVAAATCRCGSSPATATRCRSAATT